MDNVLSKEELFMRLVEGKVTSISFVTDQFSGVALRCYICLDKTFEHSLIRFVQIGDKNRYVVCIKCLERALVDQIKPNMRKAKDKFLERLRAYKDSHHG